LYALRKKEKEKADEETQATQKKKKVKAQEQVTSWKQKPLI
jgi:hypothetical protein